MARRVGLTTNFESVRSALDVDGGVEEYAFTFGYQPVYGLLPDVERSFANSLTIGSGAVVYPACRWRH